MKKKNKQVIECCCCDETFNCWRKFDEHHHNKHFEIPKCDGCKKEFKFDKPEDYHCMNKTWDINTPEVDGESKFYHFCSKDCLKKWLNKEK